jgi:dimethylamine monooxygenase subunit C
MEDLGSTSVPLWAVPDAYPAVPATAPGIQLSVGDATFGGGDVDAARSWLHAAVIEARVGDRVRISGTVGDCLRLRGTAVSAGLMDDEIEIVPTGYDQVGVACVPCGHITTARTGIEQVVPCAGCGRNLFVYYHVSRRTGLFMGYQADAEVHAG